MASPDPAPPRFRASPQPATTAGRRSRLFASAAERTATCATCPLLIVMEESSSRSPRGAATAFVAPFCVLVHAAPMLGTAAADRPAKACCRGWAGGVDRVRAMRCASSVDAGGDGRFADAQEPPRLAVGEAHQVDRGQRSAEVVGQRGDRREQFLLLERRLPGRPARSAWSGSLRPAARRCSADGRPFSGSSGTCCGALRAGRAARGRGGAGADGPAPARRSPGPGPRRRGAIRTAPTQRGGAGPPGPVDAATRRAAAR